MTLATIWKYTARIGTVAAIVGVLAGVYDVSQHQRERAEKESERAANESDKAILEWEEPSVFQVIAAAGKDGISFDDLQAKVRIKGLTVEQLTIPKRKLNDLALQRILIDLISKRAVVPVGTDKFRSTAEADLCGCQNPISEVTNKLTAPAIEFVSEQNGLKDVPQVLHDFREKFHLKEGEAQILFNYLVGIHCIGVQLRTGKVWNLVTTPGMSREMEGNTLFLEKPPQPQPQPMPLPSREPARDPLPQPN